MPTLVAPRPPSPVVSEEEYLRMANEAGVEFIDGRFVETHMSLEIANVTTTIIFLLAMEARKVGGSRVFSESLCFRCFPEQPKRYRKPDVSIIREERLKGLDFHGGYCPIPPDLAVEVVSPTDIADDVMGKVEDYLTHGFPCVWVVYPTTRTVNIYRGDGSTAYLRENDEITGEAALPTFRCKVGEFFVKTP